MGNNVAAGAKKLKWTSGMAWANAIFCLAAPFFCLILWLLYRPFDNTLLTRNLYPVTLVIGMFFPLVGAIILSRLPGNATGWIFSLSGLSVTLSNTGLVYSVYSLYQARINLPGGGFASWFFGGIWLPGMSLLLLLPQIFPNGKPLSSRWNWLLGTTVVLAVVNFIAWCIATWPIRGRYLIENGYKDISSLVGDGSIEINAGVVLYQVCGSLLAILTLASILSLLLRFRRAAGVERLQLKWFSYAICVAIMLLLISIQFNPAGSNLNADLFSLLFLTLNVLAFAAVPVGITVGILKYRLYDIDLLINRTILYIALTMAVSGLYIGLVTVLGSLFNATGNLYLSLFATGVVAVIFNPLRNSLQKLVNRLLYGNRDEPYKIISRLSRRLEGAFLPETVLPVIVETVAEALKLPYAGIELEQDGEFIVAAASGTPVAQPVRLPLVYQARKLGYLVLAPRQAGEAFTPADRQLLEELARQAGAAAYAVMVTADLQRSREMLVTSREEERRRIRRDLHDGLGPVLASMTLVVDTIRLIMPSNRERAETMLVDLKRQIQSTVSDIRRLVYELRPPVLDEFGLVAALQEYADQISQQNIMVEVAVSEELPTLSAALEVAVYRIVQEALTNVVKHSRASHAEVELKMAEQNLDYNAFHLRRLNSRLLEITVRDDGRGYHENFYPGVGLHSIRERTAELGGTVQIENNVEGGACIKVQLPFVPETTVSGKNTGGEVSLRAEKLTNAVAQEK